MKGIAVERKAEDAIFQLPGVFFCSFFVIIIADKNHVLLCLQLSGSRKSIRYVPDTAAHNKKHEITAWILQKFFRAGSVVSDENSIFRNRIFNALSIMRRSGKVFMTKDTVCFFPENATLCHGRESIRMVHRQIDTVSPRLV